MRSDVRTFVDICSKVFSSPEPVIEIGSLYAPKIDY